MLDYLFEFGPTKGDGPLEPQDVKGIEYVLGVKFMPWEKRLLLQLSREYRAESFAATKGDTPPPWEGAAKQWKYTKVVFMERNLDAALKNKG